MQGRRHRQAASNIGENMRRKNDGPFSICHPFSVIVFVVGFVLVAQPSSPAPPQIPNSITFDGSENHFVIPGNAGDANGYTVDRTFHAVLVSNLGVSFDVAAMA